MRRHPLVPHFDMGSLHRRPSGAMRDLLLPRVSGVGREGMIEGFAINILRVRWQVVPNREGKVGV
jgi:hypothetical protein